MDCFTFAPRCFGKYLKLKRCSPVSDASEQEGDRRQGTEFRNQKTEIPNPELRTANGERTAHCWPISWKASTPSAPRYSADPGRTVPARNRVHFQTIMRSNLARRAISS